MNQTMKALRKNQTMRAFRKMFDIPYKRIEEETGIPVNSWASYETGRRPLGEQATRRLSDATGIAAKCFHAENRSRRKFLNTRGEPYTREDFALSKYQREPEGGWDSSINRRQTSLTLLVSWYLLDAINQETLSTGIGLGRFQDDLNRFVGKELSRVPSLQKRYRGKSLNLERLLKWLQEWRTEFQELVSL
jgi:transcriptional regulator with XRE-family HTH domain